MKTAAVLAAASGLLTLVTAQTYPEITWRDIANNTREIWCEQQIGICPRLCQDQNHVDAEYNDCWWEDLHYECICEGGFRPNLTEYSLTIPYNLCMESKQQCANNCGNNQDCVSLCFSAKQCGASDPRRVTVTTTSTTATGTSTSTSKPTGDADTTDSESEPTETNDPFGDNGTTSSFTAFGSVYGVGVMIAGMTIGFFGML